MDHPEDDIKLMLRAKDGDEKAFEALVERHQTRVYHLAYRFLGNAEDAQDAAQEAFVKVYQARKTYQPYARFTTWLYTIVKNTCLKALARARPTVSLDEDMGTGEGAMPRQVADPNMPTPAETLRRKEQAELVRRAVDSLPEPQRLAVLLSRFEGMSYEEIAGVLGCSAKAVKSMLHRARLALRERLEPAGKL